MDPLGGGAIEPVGFGAGIGTGGFGLATPAMPAPAGGADPYADQGLSRNALCPCGSGAKYKHCHGAAA